jgi:hypothetical protein
MGIGTDRPLQELSVAKVAKGDEWADGEPYVTM